MIYYGEQTKQALQNFLFPVSVVSKDLTYAIVEVKKAAAQANCAAGDLEREYCESIVAACDEVLTGNYDDQFVTPSVQGGAGTSIHMNVNEVIASIATELLKNKNIDKKVHPNDHVNMSQSTNDVNPSALRICSIRLVKKLVSEVEALISVLDKRSAEFAKTRKLARTHIQDAVPTTIGAEFASYKATLQRDLDRLKTVLPLLHELNLGGTAIGNSINASDAYIKHVYEVLPKIVQLPVVPMQNMMSGTSSTTDFVHLSGAVTTIALTLSKISHDLRYMASGPRGGIQEITLQMLQPGSSIMPGKINPVIPESMNQQYYFIVGKNQTVLAASEASHLELAIMFPVIAESIISSLQMVTAGVQMFNTKCIATLTVNESRCNELLEESMAYATLFTPRLGYDVVSNKVKEAVKTGKTLRQVLLSSNLITESEFEKIISSYE